MKRIGALIAIVSLVFVFVSDAFAAEYKVYVTRLDDNLYQDRNSGAIIKTSLCLELSLGDEAILIWSGSNYYACGKLIFISSGRTCQVDGVYR
jgi:hypothetical protein